MVSVAAAKAPIKRPKTDGRQPGLDLLRSLAIVLVVFHHAGAFGFELPQHWERFGWVGVDLFFVLSGYLIGGQLLAQLQERNTIGFGLFYVRRALRILPAYFVVLAVYFCFPAWREFPSISPLWKYLLSVQNIGLHQGTAFSHAWSLAVEDQFYFLLPLILLFVVRSPRAALAVPCLIFVSGLLLRAFLVMWQTDSAGNLPDRAFDVWIYYPTWSRLDPLVFGVALAAIQKHRSSWWSVITNSGTWLWLPAIAAVAGGLYIDETASAQTAGIWEFPLIAAGMAMFLICSVSKRLPFHRLELPGVAFLARIAYSVYLSHKLVVHFVAGLCSKYSIAPTSFVSFLVLGALVCVCGAILFFAVERPFLQIRSRIAT